MPGLRLQQVVVGNTYYCEPADEDECPNGCGQPTSQCSCAELASLRRHNADPATRGSHWMA